MNIIKYETPIENIDFSLQSVFFMGPTVRGNQPHLKSWRPDAVALFKAKKFAGNLILPEFEKPTESDKYRYDVPQWEFAGLQKCHVIMLWLPRTRDLIGLTTNWEMGYWVARDRNKLVYGRPDDAYRVTYCDIMWVEDARRRQKEAGTPTMPDVTIHNTLEKTVDAVLKRFVPWSLM